MEREKKIQLLKDISTGKIRIAELNRKPLNFRFERIGDIYRDTLSGMEMTLEQIDCLDIGAIEPGRITRLNMVGSTGEPATIRINTEGKFL